MLPSRLEHNRKFGVARMLPVLDIPSKVPSGRTGLLGAEFEHDAEELEGRAKHNESDRTALAPGELG
jgi:hypothetical protein